LVTAVRRAVQASGQATLGQDDDVLVAEADGAVHAHGDSDLAHKLDALVSPAERALAQLRLAEQREREGSEDAAIDLLERASSSGALDAEARARVSARLKALLGRAGRVSEAEALLRSELARGSLPPAVHARVAHDLADLLLRRDEKQAAFEVLAELASEGGP